MEKKKTAVLSDGKTAELTFDEAILAVELYSKELARLTASVNKANSVISLSPSRLLYAPFPWHLHR